MPSRGLTAGISSSRLLKLKLSSKKVSQFLSYLISSTSLFPLGTDPRFLISTSAGGVDDQSAMKKVSELWHKLTPEEKKAFANRIDDGLTDEEHALDDDSEELIVPVEPVAPATSRKDSVPTSGQLSLRTEGSFRHDYLAVQSFVNDFVAKVCVPVIIL